MRNQRDENKARAARDVERIRLAVEEIFRASRRQVNTLVISRDGRVFDCTQFKRELRGRIAQDLGDRVAAVVRNTAWWDGSSEPPNLQDTPPIALVTQVVPTVPTVAPVVTPVSKTVTKTTTSTCDPRSMVVIDARAGMVVEQLFPGFSPGPVVAETPVSPVQACSNDTYRRTRKVYKLFCNNIAKYGYAIPAAVVLELRARGRCVNYGHVLEGACARGYTVSRTSIRRHWHRILQAADRLAAEQQAKLPVETSPPAVPPAVVPTRYQVICGSGHTYAYDIVADRVSPMCTAQHETGTCGRAWQSITVLPPV
jgi:hypothetical protein